MAKLSNSGVGGAMPVQQGAALEQHLAQGCAEIPEAGVGREQLPELKGARTQIAGDRKLRQHVCKRDAVGRRCCMQHLLGLPDIGTLFDQLRRNTDGQFRRQRQILEMEDLLRFFRWQSAEQGCQCIAALAELLLQRGQGGRGLRFNRLLRE